MDDKIETSAEMAESDVLRVGNAVHTDGTTSPEQHPLPVAVGKKPVAKKSPAEWAYQRLILYIQNFEKTLDENHEVAMGFTDTGAGVLRIQGMGHFDPDIVTFYGTDQTGSKVQLVQHLSLIHI